VSDSQVYVATSRFLQVTKCMKKGWDPPGDHLFGNLEMLGN